MDVVVCTVLGLLVGAAIALAGLWIGYQIGFEDARGVYDPWNVRR